MKNNKNRKTSRQLGTVVHPSMTQKEIREDNIFNGAYYFGAGTGILVATIVFIILLLLQPSPEGILGSICGAGIIVLIFILKGFQITPRL